MNVIFFLFLVISFYGIAFKHWNVDFLDKPQTDSIKGIFVLVVFASHLNQYLIKSGWVINGLLEQIYYKIPLYMSQLMVVMFLFYSGYGVFESIKSKGFSYVKLIPKHRMLPLYLNFAISVLLFYVLFYIIEERRDVSLNPLYLVGWESFGNPSWYIEVILLCYMSTWLPAALTSHFCHIDSPKTRLKIIAWGGVFFGIVIWFVLWLSKAFWWYNTVMTYYYGIIFSLYKEDILYFLRRYYYVILFCLSVFFGGLFMSNGDIYAIKYNILSICFSTLIVTISLKIRIGNDFLRYLGRNLFPAYIYQFVPFIILSYVINHYSIDITPLTYSGISIMVTLLIISTYHYWQIKL